MRASAAAHVDVASRRTRNAPRACAQPHRATPRGASSQCPVAVGSGLRAFAMGDVTHVWVAASFRNKGLSIATTPVRFTVRRNAKVGDSVTGTPSLPAER